jgi:general secretion pathway protein D
MTAGFLSAMRHSAAASRHHARRAFIFLVCVAVGNMLAGCAAQMAFREGRGLIEEGKIEDGLVKLHDAVEQDPRNLEYRKTYLQARDQALESLLGQADRLAAAGRAAQAKTRYQRVRAIDPNNDRARAGMEALETASRHVRLMSEANAAWEKKDVDLALLKLRMILAENPQHAAALALKRAIADKTATLPPETALSTAYRKPITIEFKDAPLKQVLEVISRTAGLNFLLDKDVKTDQKTSVFLKNSTVASAIHFVLLTNQLEQQVLDGNTILIYPNTANKLKDYQEMVVKTFYLANAEAKSVANTLKTIVKSKDIVVDDKLNMVIVRDSPEAIRLAEKLVALHDVPEPEVMLEVEILEIKRTRLLDLGIQWPDSLTLTPLPSLIPPTAGTGTSSSTSGTLTLRDLRSHLNGGTIGAALGPTVINANKTDTDANILANPRIRAHNHEKAKILIGDRVPNITSTSTATGFVSESVNYVDVGLKLEVEPTVYLDGEVAIKVGLEVSNIVSQLQTKAGSIAYQIGTRNASTALRLKDGENQVLAGLINNEDRSTANKVPGLGELPIVGRLFGSTSDDNQKTEIVLSITPHIIRNIQRPDAALSEFRSGTDSSFHSSPEIGTVPPGAAVNASATQPIQQESIPAARMSATGTPTMGASSATGNNAVIGDASVAPPTFLAAARLNWVGPTQVKNGATFSVQLAVKPEQAIVGFPVTISFDPNTLQVMSMTEGDLLKQGGATTSFTSRFDPNGQIILTGVRSGGNGATAPGTFATISFRALAPTDASRIQVLDIAPTGLSGQPVITAPLAPLTVRITP